MILFFDTETTGFFDDRLPVDHEAQPYIVQIAAQLCEGGGSPVAGFSFIVRYPEVEIPERAAAVHGITTEKAIQFGVSAEFALGAFTHLYQRANLVCAHNIKFDKGILEVAIARHYGKAMPLRKPLFCTMEAASPVVNLPPTERMRAAGFDKPKPPKLEECVQHFFNEKLEGAHDAMVDVIACRRVYLHLKAIETSNGI
jgi:DNA polymerase-3 subunit epsilon